MPTLLTGGAGKAGVAASAFVPSTITGLAAWFKADAIGGKVDGDAIATWSDSSGNTRDATQATGSAQPIYKTNILNGNPVLRFASANASTVATATYQLNGGSTPAGITVFAVASLTTAGSFPGIALYPSGTNELRGNGVTGRMEFSVGGAAPALNPAATIVGTGAHVITGVLVNLGHPFVYVDGVGTTTGSSSTALPTTAVLTLGGRSTHYWDGDIAEVLMFNTGLSDGDRLNVERYLGAKYGLAVA